MKRGKLLSWPAPPLEWIGHTSTVTCTSYSPNGCYIASGSVDRTIRIWDAETGSAVGEPLEGHTSYVWSVAYSPDGRHIVSGSLDKTIRIWDAETGAAVGDPLEGHNDYVHFVANSPATQLLVSGSIDRTVALCCPIPPVSRHVSSPGHQIYAELGALHPDSDGWLKDSEGNLLYWVPKDCRMGLHSPALMTIPRTSDIRSVSLDFEGFIFGTSWTQIFNITQP